MDFIHVNIKLTRKQTTLCGDSATGKSYLYNIIKQYVQDNPSENILCLDIGNADIRDSQYTLDKLKKMNNGLIIIDQADDVFEAENIEEYITYDRDNFYIIIGRKYYQRYSELAYPVITRDSISIQYLLNTV